MSKLFRNGGAGLNVKLRKAAAIAVLLALTGCFKTSADELYRLPRVSDEYFKLQTRIDEVTASGAEYSPPTSGENRQSVQLEDIDGDGVKEAIAFFAARSEDYPLKIYIFKSDGDDYVIADIIEGTGTGIESIRYADMDGDGVLELVVGWQMGASLKNMSLYLERGFQHVKVAEADYTTALVSDITGDGLPDVSVVRLGTAETPGEIEVFSLMPDGEIVGATAHLSDGVEAVSRAQAGKLFDGVPAVVIDGKAAGGGIVTDIFCRVDGALVNIARTSAEDAEPRTLTVYSTDIDRDGIIDMPYPVPLPQQSDTVYYAIDWRSYSSDGSRRVAMTTYHNYSDGWYLTLPEAWRGRLTVRRADAVYGERSLVFSFVNGGEAVSDFLKIYTLSGENKEERARLPGRFRLLEEGDKIFAAELFNPGAEHFYAPAEADIRLGFHRIYTDWLTGS
ncbi:MAG: VCBS repeat-containing protein [Oscillospiraceae bacterium]|jgi:hypothetical protein|nr:VCBS repeat-containing protein [Oscillospiraceae bacterium]